MVKYHSEILSELEKYRGKGTKYQSDRDKTYIGSKKISFGIKSSIKKQLIKGWIKRNNKITQKDYVSLLTSLYKGKSHDEISVAGRLLELIPKLRSQLNPDILDEWLSNVEGWAEVDSLCQSNFTCLEMLDKWNDWKKLLSGLSKSDNVHKRRASLVLLTGPVRHSSESRLTEISFKNINKLKHEKDILITKAISWLLRDLIKNNRSAVTKFLNDNEKTLPKIAIRETKRKLLTGRKS